jgi:uncharacterized RDD family membrane protein YckC
MDKRVGFGPRLGAAVIDAVIIMVVGGMFGGMLAAALGLGAGAAAGLAGGEDAAAAAAALGAMGGFAIGISLFGLLYSLIEAFTGASPGKMILKLKIGTDDGRNAPAATYLTRWAVKYSNSLLSTIGLITGISIIGTLGTVAGVVVFFGCFLVLGAGRQAVHDLVAKTAVYYKADLT